MKKKTWYSLFLFVVVIAVLAITGDVMAQPPGLPSAPDQAPIDGGLGLLAAAGGAYALNKIRKSKKG